jgi:putative (di)nucleoside polyphosphate hydrolase
VIDKRGYRVCVGMIVANTENKLFLGKRIGHSSGWQFPQGGLHSYETLKEAMYRELWEELGLKSEDVEILGISRQWIYYKIPPHLRRHNAPICIGQRQKWFLLRLIGGDEKICFTRSDSPEFAGWEWVDYWEPVNKVIYFKRHVYKLALRELESFLGVPKE